MKVETGPSVLFSKLAWQKMWALVHSCKIEISWFGYCMPDDEKDSRGIEENFYIEDIYVVDQECTGVKSDMLPTAVSDLCVKLMDEGKDPSRLKLWGHSHVDMDVGFSGTDESTIEKLELEPLISIVLNKRGDVNIRVDQWEPWRHSFPCTYNVEDVQLISSEWADEMVKNHVKKPKVTYGLKKSKTKNGVIKSSWHDHYGTGWDSTDTWGFGYGSSTKKEPTKKEAETLSPIDMAVYEIDLPKELEFLEEMFIQGSICINELLEGYAHYRLNNDDVEELMDWLSIDDPKKEASVVEGIEFIPEEGDVIEESEDVVDPNEDPFYYNENPGSVQKLNGSKSYDMEAK